MSDRAVASHKQGKQCLLSYKIFGSSSSPYVSSITNFVSIRSIMLAAHLFCLIAEEWQPLKLLKRMLISVFFFYSVKLFLSFLSFIKKNKSSIKSLH